MTTPIDIPTEGRQWHLIIGFEDVKSKLPSQQEFFLLKCEQDIRDDQQGYGNLSFYIQHLNFMAASSFVGIFQSNVSGYQGACIFEIPGVRARPRPLILPSQIIQRVGMENINGQAHKILKVAYGVSCR